MSNMRIQSILHGVLEEEIPSSEINLWPTVKASLVAGNQIQKNQGQMMNALKTRRVPRFALAVSLVLMLLIVIIATPQGRSFAQSVLDLFTQTEGTTFPLEESQINDDGIAEISPTAFPPAPLISVVEAEAYVGFDLAEAPFVPEGFEYLGARLYGNYVNIEYMTKGYGHLIITQSKQGYNQSDWGNVPADDILSVKIGDLEGELVQGTFIRLPGDDIATWNPNAAFTRLRWVNKGIWFEIALYGDAHEYFNMAELITLAESLAPKP